MATEKQSSGVNMQHQIRQNSEELQNFLEDLNKWEDEVHGKDKLLSCSKDIATSTYPVRNKAVEQNPTTTVKIEQRKAKNKSYDYRAWDNFDANQAFVDIDNEDGESDCESEEYIEQRKLQQALFEKQKGNALFGEGKYEAACNRYTTAITLDPSNAIYPANRAMTLIKLKRYGAAIQDCDLALHLDKTYIKAYARRANAKQQLGKLDEALQDYEIMLKLQPENKQAIEKIDRIKKIKDKTGSSNIYYKPVKRYVIEEIGADRREENENNSDVKKERLTSKLLNSTELLYSERGKQRNGTNVKESMSNIRVDYQREMSDNNDATDTNIDLTIPLSSVQFLKTWQQLEKYPEQRYKYMKMIPPHSLPQVIGESLESSLLLNMFSILKEFYIRDKLCIFNEMKNISELKRFSMTLMFLTDKEKSVLCDLFDYLSQEQAKHTFSEQELHILQEKYEHR